MEDLRKIYILNPDFSVSEVRGGCPQGTCSLSEARGIVYYLDDKGSTEERWYFEHALLTALGIDSIVSGFRSYDNYASYRTEKLAIKPYRQSWGGGLPLQDIEEIRYQLFVHGIGDASSRSGCAGHALKKAWREIGGPRGLGKNGGTPLECVKLAKQAVRQGPGWISQNWSKNVTMIDQKAAYKRALFSPTMPSFDHHPFPVSGNLIPTTEEIEAGFFQGSIDASWNVPYAYLPCAPFRDEYGETRWVWGENVRLQINGQLASLLAGMGGKIVKVHSCIRYGQAPESGNRHLQWIGELCNKLPKLASKAIYQTLWGLLSHSGGFRFYQRTLQAFQNDPSTCKILPGSCLPWEEVIQEKYPWSFNPVVASYVASFSAVDTIQAANWIADKYGEKAVCGGHIDSVIVAGDVVPPEHWDVKGKGEWRGYGVGNYQIMGEKSHIAAMGWSEGKKKGKLKPSVFDNPERRKGRHPVIGGNRAYKGLFIQEYQSREEFWETQCDKTRYWENGQSYPWFFRGMARYAKSARDNRAAPHFVDGRELHTYVENGRLVYNQRKNFDSLEELEAANEKARLEARLWCWRHIRGIVAKYGVETVRKARNWEGVLKGKIDPIGAIRKWEREGIEIVEEAKKDVDPDRILW